MSREATYIGRYLTFDGFYGDLSHIGLATLGGDPSVEKPHVGERIVKCAAFCQQFVREFVLAYWKCEQRVEEEMTLAEMQAKPCG